MRFYYYAIPNRDGQWEVVSSRDRESDIHPTKESALLAAKIKCRRYWEEHGQPCGVRFRVGDSEWEDHELFGGDDESEALSGSTSPARFPADPSGKRRN